MTDERWELRRFRDPGDVVRKRIEGYREVCRDPLRDPLRDRVGAEGSGPPKDRSSTSVPIADVEDPAELPVAGLCHWYQDMAPVWLSAQPLTRRRLVLRVHRWIADEILAPMSRGEPPSAGDLRPGGRFGWTLFRTVPRCEAALWDGWIRLALVDLQHALAWPPPRRSEVWLRWLFLIPYSLPVPRRSAALLESDGMAPVTSWRAAPRMP